MVTVLTSGFVCYILSYNTANERIGRFRPEIGTRPALPWITHHVIHTSPTSLCFVFKPSLAVDLTYSTGAQILTLPHP